MPSSKFLIHTTLALSILALTACGTSRPADTPPAPATVAPATVAPTVPAPTVEATPDEATQPATAPPESAPTASAPTAAPSVEPTVAPLSFTAATYTDASAGIALDYPADWTLSPNSQVGVRGGQAVLLSPNASLDTLAAGATRVTISTNLWDPKGDLVAYVTQRKTAWEASGFAITHEASWTLPDGRAAQIFIVQSPDTPVFYLLTTIGDDYLSLIGEGDLELVEEIAHTLRPLE